MSARDRLWHLYQHPGSPLDFEEALDAYAHELAEKIRQAAASKGTVAWAEPMFQAADLIDPKKK